MLENHIQANIHGMSRNNILTSTICIYITWQNTTQVMNCQIFNTPPQNIVTTIVLHCIKYNYVFNIKCY